MRLLSFSSSFPSSDRPTEGIFVYERLAALAGRVEGLTVAHPVPAAPLLGPRRSRDTTHRRETIGGLTVHHRRYLYLPGVLKRMDGYFYFRGVGPWAERHCRRHGVTLLDAHFAWPDGVGVSLIARRLHLPYVITLRGTINPRAGKRAFRGRLAAALQGAAAVISVSKPMAETARQLGADPSRIFVIPNGVDAAAFTPCDRTEARRRLGLDDRPLLVCVAALKAAKGQAELICALSHLPQKPRLVLIGGAADRAGHLRLLRTLPRRCRLEGQVQFAGRLGRQEVIDFLNAADVSVLPSHSEGCPNVVLESLACGTPVVATAVGAVPDLVHSPELGLLVPPRDVRALAAAIDQALRRDWSRQAIRESVRGRSWAVVAAEVMDVLGAAGA